MLQPIKILLGLKKLEVEEQLACKKSAAVQFLVQVLRRLRLPHFSTCCSWKNDLIVQVSFSLGKSGKRRSKASIVTDNWKPLKVDD